MDGILFQHGAIGEEMEPSRRLILTVKELSFRYQKPIALCYLTEEEELAFVKRTIDYPIFAEPSDALECPGDFEGSLLSGKNSRERASFPSGEPDRVKHLFEKAREEKRDPLLPEAFEVLQGLWDSGRRTIEVDP